MIQQWLDAWRLWLAGSPTANFVLWGVPILWWGRVGKIIQAIGGFTIILDVIGYERLNLLGRRLRSAYEPQTAEEIAQELDRKVRAARHRIMGHAAAYALEEHPVFYERLLNSELVLLIVKCGHWVVLYTMVSWLFFSTYSKHLLRQLLNLLLTALGVAVIYPIARVLQNRRLKTITQIAGVLLLLIGLHFDLLSS